MLAGGRAARPGRLNRPNVQAAVNSGPLRPTTGARRLPGG